MLGREHFLFVKVFSGFTGEGALLFGLRRGARCREVVALLLRLVIYLALRVRTSLFGRPPFPFG